MKETKFNTDELPQLLPYYYNNLFPYRQFYKWLSYGNIEPDYFSRREFSFTLEGDIYIRYLSFNDAESLKSALIQKNPVKIDIGAVYNIPPKDSKKNLAPFIALHRELVFDIDLTDYDDIRKCCSSANICKKCWRFMVIAAKILNRILKDDFGFKNILFVYSGRRGLHCWINDERARKLPFEARAAIVDYITVVDGGEFKNKKVSYNSRYNLHPSINCALQIIEEYFLKLITEQGWLDDEEGFKKIVQLCSNDYYKEELLSMYNPNLKPADLWKKVETRIKYLSSNKQNTHFLEEVKLQYCYPRLDANVSKGLNHLLKVPFSVHPKTGNICVPIDIKNIDEFDPFTVPKLHQICDEIDEFDKKLPGSKIENYEKTSLKQNINLFNCFINNLANENKVLKLKKSDEKMEF